MLAQEVVEEHLIFLEGYLAALRWVLEERPKRKQIEKRILDIEAEQEAFERYLDEFFWVL